MGVVHIGSILYDEKLFQNDNKIVIFGSGTCGKRVAAYLQENGMADNIICFCDSNRDKKCSNIMGIPVCIPGEVCKSHPDADYLISGKYSEEMYAFLKSNHIEKIHIIVI